MTASERIADMLNGQSATINQLFPFDGLAIDDLDRKSTLTYFGLRHHAVALAAELSRLCAAGEVVALRYGNQRELFVGFLAGLISGTTVVALPIETCQFRVRSIIKSSGARVIVHDPKDNIVSEAERELAKISFSSFGVPDVSAEELSILDRSIDLNSRALILFTSGTTGVPKGIQFRLRSCLFFALNILRSCEISDGNTELLIPAASHSDGWQRGLATLLSGGRLCLVSTSTLLSRFRESILAVNPDSFFLPTPMIPVLLRADQETKAFLNLRRRSVELGSTPISTSMFKKLVDEFPTLDFYYHYGLTECSRATTLNVKKDRAKWKTVGRANVGYTVMTRSGRIRVENPLRPTEFIVDGRHETDPEGALTTRDLGSLDEDGFLTHLGRVDGQLTLGGHHIFPREIVEIMQSLEGVLFCAVENSGDVDPVFGDMIEIVTVLEDGVQQEAFLTGVPSLMRPYVRFLDKVPMVSKGMQGARNE